MREFEPYPDASNGSGCTIGWAVGHIATRTEMAFYSTQEQAQIDLDNRPEGHALKPFETTRDGRVLIDWGFMVNY